ncbi:MAG: MFS transporter [Planctomycetaceae bacterium]
MTGIATNSDSQSANDAALQLSIEGPTSRSFAQRFPIYYGWINVLMAAWTMTATLPGRTHGLGLITKPLLEDLRIPESSFAQLNLWSSLLGALFCVPVGAMIDRLGVRTMSVMVTGLLAMSVFQMSAADGVSSLLISLILVRGFGQSALSIVSMAIIGKWFRGRLGPAMGLYTVLLTFGFIGSILGMGSLIQHSGWRDAWQTLGWWLLASVPVLWAFTRSTPELCGIEPDPISSSSDVKSPRSNEAGCRDYTVFEALQTPAFWVFVLGTSAFNLVWSSITLFNESILGELGFDQSMAVQMMAFLTGVGLLANIIGGKLASRERAGLLLSCGLLMLAASLALFPSIRTVRQLQLYGSAMGFVGGLVTVVHFAAWGHFFGRSELGRIQGVAQVVTVVASAIGPLLMATSRDSRNSYLPIFSQFALCVFVLAIAAAIVKIPARLRGDVLFCTAENEALCPPETSPGDAIILSHVQKNCLSGVPDGQSSGH